MFLLLKKSLNLYFKNIKINTLNEFNDTNHIIKILVTDFNNIVTYGEDSLIKNELLI